MAIVPYSSQDEYDLVHDEQDCRGKAVVDGQGNRIGVVKEMMVDTDTDLVSHFILEDGTEIPARQVSLADNAVVVRGYDAKPPATRSTTESVETRAPRPGVSDTATASAAVGARNAEGEITLTVVEEQIRVGKRTVERGGVRVHSRMTERPVEESVTLREETVHVDRRPVNRAVSEADMAAVRGGAIEVTETDEEAVVAKQLRVVEEVIVGKQVTEREETIRDTVRRTDVEVEQVDVDATAKGKSPNR